MGHALQVVVVRVLCHATVEEGPGEVVHSILLVLHRLGDYLGVEVVVEEVVQVGLERRGEERGGEGKRERRGGEERGGEGKRGEERGREGRRGEGRGGEGRGGERRGGEGRGREGGC